VPLHRKIRELRAPGDPRRARGDLFMRLTRFNSIRAFLMVFAMTGAASAVQAAVPAPWLASDVGAPSPAGTSSLSSGTFTITASGVDIWGTSDQFHFVYQQMSGDFEVSARVDSLTNTNSWAKAGVMMRTSMAANSAAVFTGVTPGNGVTFQQRSAAGAWSQGAGLKPGSAPRWVRLVRAGNNITASMSTDGSQWTAIGTVTVSLGSSVYVGLAVTSHSPGVATTAKMSNVAIKGAAGVPAPQKAADIGSPAIKGGTTYAGGQYTINAGGVDIWSTSDQFHYVYQPMDGDVEVIARVNGLGAANGWSKSGVMVRETLAANSRHAYALVSVSNGYALQRRIDVGGYSATTSGGAGAAPGWVRLVRTGHKFDGYRSSDGKTWTLMGSDTVPMAASVYVGIAVTSHNASVGTTSLVDNLTIKSSASTPGTQPPTVALTSPTTGASFSAPASISLTATASDPEGRLSHVNFYAGTTQLASDTTAPYSFTWSSVPAGTYAVKAVAYDTDGGTASSTVATVTVTGSTPPPPSPAPRNVVFTASADHSTMVTSYRLEVFAAGANPATATPVATSDLGKPTPATSGDITVDRGTFFNALAAGNYVATVSAIGSGGTSRSTSVTFTR
jgi:regulation of enolase protein 1 (concanavalin A-like superfamily)